MATLFSEAKIKNCKIKNRIIFPAMVLFDVPAPEGKINPKHLEHFEWLANSGIGMIITCAFCVNPKGKLHANQLGVWSDDMIEGLSKIPPVCHDKDVPILMQIHHAGARTVPASSADIISSSEFQVKDGVTAREITVEEIKELQKEFVNAAIRAEKSGFDGIELHCAHTYLIDQFLSPVINKRTDEYGGSPENRARFATEIIEEIKKSVNQDFIIGCRVGCNLPTIEDGVVTAELLEKAGADFLDVSFSTIATPEIVKGNGPQAPDGFPYHGIIYGASQIKKNVSIPVSTVWQVTQEDAKGIIENGYTDFIDICRGLLVEPDWVTKTMNGVQGNKCFNCRPACRWFSDREKCPAWCKLDEGKRLAK